MSEEQKKECNCDCKKLAAKFLFLTASVFLGVLLAIIFAAHLLKPPVPPMPCPCQRGMHGIPPRMERQIPPEFFREDVKIYKIEDGAPARDIHRKDFKKGHQDFKNGRFPQKGERPQAPRSSETPETPVRK